VQQFLLFDGQLLSDRLRQPAIPVGSVTRDLLPAGVRQLHQCPAPVVLILRTGDEAVGLELAQRLTHRLRPYPLALGEFAGGQRALPIEPPEYGDLGQAEPVLHPQPSNHPADDDPQLAGQRDQLGAGYGAVLTLHGCDRRRHGSDYTGELVIGGYEGCLCNIRIVSSAATVQVRGGGPSPQAEIERSANYKWVALSNTTLAVLLATLDGSITIIAMPDIFRGIKLNPLQAGNSFYLLWMVLGYLIVSSVLIVSLGRLGDMFGRVRLYNAGFVIYTAASLALTVDWMTGHAGALYLVIFRLFQGVGGAFLLGNSGAILTDAFPSNQRGMALGINNIVGVSGTFVGLVLGGLLAPISWRAVFLISVPVGLFGTVWAYLKLKELSKPHRGAGVDWWGNITFAVGLVLIMISITYGIRPYGTDAMGWTSPRVLILLGAGVLSLVAFAFVEQHAREPMFRLPLLKIRAFTFGTLSTFLSSISRGGLMFMLIIWLQGIWLPEHGVDFADTPLKAGLCMLPLTFGMLCSGPTFGYLSDRYGARLFATSGMLVTAAAFVLMWLLPTNFNFLEFAAVLLMMGVGMGMFASPNRAAVMNSLPPGDRGAGGGMNQTFQNSAQVLSVGVFFSLMIAGLASSLPRTLANGLHAHGVPLAKAVAIGHVPPVSVLFAAFLGYNPIKELAGTKVLSHLSAHSQALLTGRTFFPELISAPFRTGLHVAFAFAIVACLIAAGASLMRGGMYRHGEEQA
jgi:MFS family permease